VGYLVIAFQEIWCKLVKKIRQSVGWHLAKLEAKIEWHLFFVLDAGHSV